MPLPENMLGGPAQLTWYIGQDRCLYAHELQTDGLFKIYLDIADLTGVGAEGAIPEAPTDGQLYGRESAAWEVVPTGGGNAVQKTGDTMTGTLDINNPEAITTVGNVRLTGRGNILQVDTAVSFFTVNSDGSLGWNLSWAGVGGVKLRPDTANGGLMVEVGTGAGIELNDLGANVIGSLHWSAGDLVITQTTGPNAGKSVNLTAGFVGGALTDAPANGETYARLNNGWSAIVIPATSILIQTIQPVSAVESTSPTITVNGSGFTATSVINWGGYPLLTTLVDSDTLTATLNLGPGSAGIYTVWVTDGTAKSNSVAFSVVAAAKIFSSPSDTLGFDPNGDLIVTQATGPNAGKSVNLTYGKWA